MELTGKSQNKAEQPNNEKDVVSSGQAMVGEDLGGIILYGSKILTF